MPNSTHPGIRSLDDSYSLIRYPWVSEASPLSENPEQSVPDRDSASEKARDYYDENTPGIYLSGWNRDHIHFGLFEPGECPAAGEVLADSEGLARAVERMVKVIIEPGEIQAHHHVVDAGCGVGGTAIYLARTRRCRVTGVNLNRMQLEIATEKARDAKLADRVRFDYADCSKRLPFAEASIDVVVNIESACHYGDRARFIHEVARILKPGGKIVAMDWTARDGLSREEYDRYILPLCEPFAVHGLESPTTYREKLEGAGLQVLEFAGFDGKDADNLQLVKNAYNLLTNLRLSGIDTPGIHRLTDQFQTLCDAWTNGSFELNRYCARKPEAGASTSAG